MFKPVVVSCICMNQIMENKTTTSRDALDLLIPGTQGHACCRRWEVLPLNTPAVASKSLLTAIWQLVRGL